MKKIIYLCTTQINNVVKAERVSVTDYPSNQDNTFKKMYQIIAQIIKM